MRAALLAMTLGLALLAAAEQTASVPRAWDEEALREWATPVSGLNVRPGHFPAAEYYAAPVDNLRTYPVYYPGREPAGYWDMLQKAGPRRLIEPETLRSDADYVRAGERVFAEWDVPAFRISNPRAIAAARNPFTFARAAVKARPDGTLPDLRWVPTKDGVQLTLGNCASCHERLMNDGTIVKGAPPTETPSPFGPFGMAPWAVSAVELEGDTPPVMWWRSTAVPWLQNDVHEQFKTMTPPQLGPALGPAFATGLFPRWSGSPFYPTKIPDLIGLKDRKYIDHTATHQHRGPGDVMRYAALVTYSDSSDYGPHRLLTDAQQKVRRRAPDELLYALALYIYSLQPPPNPNLEDARIAAGQQIFGREGCANCHTPPLYTNNKLTLAQGFTPPHDVPASLDILPVSVGTDPGLALKTRKGTGYYKVPSLKGLWYRGRYLHDGAVTTLEEMFNPSRVNDDFVPTGFIPAGQKTRAVKGHEFGLRLDAKERGELLAFLRSL